MKNIYVKKKKTNKVAAVLLGIGAVSVFLLMVYVGNKKMMFSSSDISMVQAAQQLSK